MGDGPVLPPSGHLPGFVLGGGVGAWWVGGEMRLLSPRAEPNEQVNTVRLYF